MTRGNSGGGGGGQNSSGNPTHKDHEKEKGTNGAAIRGSKKVDATPNRGPTRMTSP